jgi:hypothetical protein
MAAIARRKGDAKGSTPLGVVGIRLEEINLNYPLAVVK